MDSAALANLQLMFVSWLIFCIMGLIYWRLGKLPEYKRSKNLSLDSIAMQELLIVLVAGQCHAR